MRSRRALVKLLATIISVLVALCFVTRSARRWTPRPSRLLCFVLAHADRAPASAAIRDTWGARCDTLLFFRYAIHARAVNFFARKRAPIERDYRLARAERARAVC